MFQISILDTVIPPISNSNESKDLTGLSSMSPTHGTCGRRTTDYIWILSSPNHHLFEAPPQRANGFPEKTSSREMAMRSRNRWKLETSESPGLFISSKISHRQHCPNGLHSLYKSHIFSRDKSETPVTPPAPYLLVLKRSQRNRTPSGLRLSSCGRQGRHMGPKDEVMVETSQKRHRNCVNPWKIGSTKLSTDIFLNLSTSRSWSGKCEKKNPRPIEWAFCTSVSIQRWPHGHRLCQTIVPTSDNGNHTHQNHVGISLMSNLIPKTSNLHKLRMSSISPKKHPT